jgi:hypothetical protein
MSLLAIDHATFNAQFARTAFLLPHHLCGHELFSLGRLVELSKRLPAAQVEHNAGEVAVGLDPARTPCNGLSPEETIRRIVECRSWLVLKNVERDPEYRRLLEACLAEVRAASTRLTEGMRDPHAFIFVSSPGAVTPYHMDPEENFLLQIRGTKTMSVFDRADRSVVSEPQIERFFTRAPTGTWCGASSSSGWRARSTCGPARRFTSHSPRRTGCRTARKSPSPSASPSTPALPCAPCTLTR